MRTRKLASDRQKEKNFMERRPPRFLPLSPCGRGWTRCEASRTGEGFLSADRDPSSVFASRSHLLPQGEKGRKWLRSHGLLPIRQMHRTGAARRMGGGVVGGDSSGNRRGRFRRLILRRNI